VLICETAIDFKIFANALHHLEVDIVEGGSIFDGTVDRGGGSFNKVLRSLLIARAHLNPLVPAEMIREPCLAALVFPANSIAEELAIVGIALPLNTFKVHELAVNAARDWWVGRGAFYA